MFSVPENGKNEGTPLSYEKWLMLKKYRPRSISTLLSLYNSYVKYLLVNDLLVNKLSLESYAAWSREQGYSDRYISQIHWGLKTYYVYLKQVRGYKGHLYLTKLDYERVRRVALNVKELTEIKSWLSENSSSLREVLWLLFYGCGLRRSEVLRLRLSDVQVRTQCLLVTSSKGGGTRIIPLNSSQLQVLFNYINVGRPHPKKSCSSYLLLGPTGGKAGSLVAMELTRWQLGSGLGPRFCWHVLRHTIASELVQSGMEIRLVAQFLGHRNLASTHHYLHQNVGS